MPTWAKMAFFRPKRRKQTFIGRQNKLPSSDVLLPDAVARWRGRHAFPQSLQCRPERKCLSLCKQSMKIQNDTTTDDIYLSYRCYIFNLTEGCYTKAAGIEPGSIYETFHATDWYIQKLRESHPMLPLRVQNRHHVVFSCSVEYIVSRLALPPEHKNKPTAYVFLPSADDIENQEFWECSEMTAKCCFWQAFC